MTESHDWPEKLAFSRKRSYDSFIKLNMEVNLTDFWRQYGDFRRQLQLDGVCITLLRRPTTHAENLLESALLINILDEMWPILGEGRPIWNIFWLNGSPVSEVPLQHDDSLRSGNQVRNGKARQMATSLYLRMWRNLQRSDRPNIFINSEVVLYSLKFRII